MTAMTDTSVPVAIVETGGKSLRVTPPSGGPVRFGAVALRSACRCAHCVRARIDGKFSDAPADITITGCWRIGHYAINVGFSDGHARGIYPWSYLLELAPAAEPATAR
jgi:DUF971 family protein